MPIHIEEFRTRLEVNKHALDEELEVQAVVQERIGREVARLNASLLVNKRALEIAEASAVSRLKAADLKLTNPMAEKEAQRDREVTAAWLVWVDSKQLAEEWTQLLNSWVTRGYNLKTLADLHGQQYFAIDHAELRSSYKAARQDVASQPIIIRRRPTA